MKPAYLGEATRTEQLSIAVGKGLLLARTVAYIYKRGSPTLRKVSNKEAKIKRVHRKRLGIN